MSQRQEGFQCNVCKKVYARRVEVHAQADKSKKKYIFVCCKCSGHKPLSCLD